jgi:hypothetical protein
MNTTDKIAKLLEKGRTITPLQALNQFGCLRLGARIHDLRSTGMDIKTINHKTDTGKWVAKYKLAKP